MKALTVRQPWAWAIAAGVKTVENRSRQTHHRGELAVHAGLATDPDGMCSPHVVEAYAAHCDRDGTFPSLGDAIRRLGSLDTTLFHHGRVVALVTVVGCHWGAGDGCCGPWGEPDSWHWELADAVSVFPAVVATGALGLWTVPADVEREVRAVIRRPLFGERVSP